MPTRLSTPASIAVSQRIPRRRPLIVVCSVLAGLLLTVLWSAEFVDSVIGGNVADTLLGHDAKATPIAGMLAGTVFAFVTGLAGTFTACNIAVFGAIAPLLGEAGGRWGRLTRTLRPLGWLAAGTATVSAVYGAIVGLAGTRMPQFSTARSVAGTLSPRGVQSMVVFGVIGLVLCYLGLAALRLVPDPLASLTRRFPGTPMVVMGALIGGFLVGRPFGLFRLLFRDAATSGDPWYGAAAFVLQSLGNIVIMALLSLAVSFFAGGRLQRLLAAEPARVAAVTGAALIVAGVFTFLYWDIRMLAVREIIPWFPRAPWS